jgi:hypothetical protein
MFPITSAWTFCGGSGTETLVELALEAAKDQASEESAIENERKNLRTIRFPVRVIVHHA